MTSCLAPISARSNSEFRTDRRLHRCLSFNIQRQQFSGVHLDCWLCCSCLMESSSQLSPAPMNQHLRRKQKQWHPSTLLAGIAEISSSRTVIPYSRHWTCLLGMSQFLWYLVIVSHDAKCEDHRTWTLPHPLVSITSFCHFLNDSLKLSMLQV